MYRASPQCVSFYGPLGIVTHITAEWLLSRVSPHMALEITSLNTGIVTLLTPVWLLSSVGHVVYLEVTRLSAGIVTHLTFEWFLPSVYSFMGL